MNAVSDVQFRDRLKRNINRTLAFGFFQVFLVIMPVVVPFFESRGLTMQQIFLLQALFAVVVLVMEIPSGYAADILGRRVTLLVGSVFIALGHSMLLFADGFAGLALFEMFLGIGIEPRLRHRPRDPVRLGSGARPRRRPPAGTRRAVCSRCTRRPRRWAACCAAFC